MDSVLGRVGQVPIGLLDHVSTRQSARYAMLLVCRNLDIIGGAALCGDWLVSSGACPVTDAIALGGVWISPLVDRGAPPAPRGLSFAVRSGGRPCRAVFVWFYTTHTPPHPGADYRSRDSEHLLGG